MRISSSWIEISLSKPLVQVLHSSSALLLLGIFIFTTHATYNNMLQLWPSVLDWILGPAALFLNLCGYALFGWWVRIFTSDL
jgi:hypothetical protein